MQEKIYLAALHSLGFNSKKLFSIFENNRNYKEIYENIDKKSLEIYGFKVEKITKILKIDREKLLKDISKKIVDLDVKIVTFFDDDYPEALRHIFNVPFLFYLQGTIPEKDFFAVVGSRKITAYGEKAIEKIIPDLSRYFTIVSGGAGGIDTFAHKQAIINGKTLVVLGTGIDISYPASNISFYKKLTQNGSGVMSIFPIGTLGTNYTFPIRNEIVAGLSIGVLVVEAQIKSGSLITAKLALDLGKDVFAIPGNINSPNSTGTNNLIYSGEAKIICEANHILSEYGISVQNKPVNKNIKFNDDIEKQIYELLSLFSLTNDEIRNKLNLDISFLNLKLSMMELGGFIKRNKLSKYEVV